MIRPYATADVPAMREIWNRIVSCGNAFPQLEELTGSQAGEFFASQDFCGVKDSGEIEGFYILHPNNVGRCGHIANASYAVSEKARGRGTGTELVLHSLKKAHEIGYRILQFNAVVDSNILARTLYEKLGFHCLGKIEGGFLNREGAYEDIYSFWKRTG